MNAIKKHLKAFHTEESAQGMVEYILLLVAVVGIAVIFKGKIKGWFEDASGKVDNSMNAFGEQ